jgi:hypothetical protein
MVGEVYVSGGTPLLGGLALVANRMTPIKMSPTTVMAAIGFFELDLLVTGRDGAKFSDVGTSTGLPHSEQYLESISS